MALPASFTISTSTTPRLIESAMADRIDKFRTMPRKSAIFDDYTLSEIRRAAATGIYDIRGAGTK